MNDFAAEPEELLATQAQAAERVIRSGWYILGEEGRRFESKFAAWAGLPRVAGVGNGMDAIEIGLRAAGIGPGDEVITTPATAFATALAIIRCGAQPVLADIDRQTALLDMASVERCIGPKTKAVLFVHLYGQVPDLDAGPHSALPTALHFLKTALRLMGHTGMGGRQGVTGLLAPSVSTRRRTSAHSGMRARSPLPPRRWTHGSA